MQSWLEGRNWVWKCAQPTGMTASLRKLSSKADSNIWESFTRSELKLESVNQESPRSDIFRKRATNNFWNKNIVRGVLPGPRRTRTGLLLSGPKSSFQMKVNFAFNLEIKIPESGGRVERHIIHVAWSPGVLLRGRWETPDQTMQMTWRPLSKQPGLHYTWAVPQTDRLHATPHWCRNSCKMRPNQVLSAQKWTYFSEAWYFWLKYTFFWIVCNIQIFWDTEFWVFIICSHNHKNFKK